MPFFLLCHELISQTPPKCFRGIRLQQFKITHISQLSRIICLPLKIRRYRGRTSVIMDRCGHFWGNFSPFLDNVSDISHFLCEISTKEIYRSHPLTKNHPILLPSSLQRPVQMHRPIPPLLLTILHSLDLSRLAFNSCIC